MSQMLKTASRSRLKHLNVTKAVILEHTAHAQLDFLTIKNNFTKR